MKLQPVLIVGVALAALFTLAQVTQSQAPPAKPAPIKENENLLPEPSFEGGTNDKGSPAGWHNIHSDPAKQYQFELAEEGRTGDRSLVIFGKGRWGVMSGPRFPIDRTLRYQARGYVKIDGDDKAAADVKVQYYDAKQKYLGESRIGWVHPRTKGWQLISMTAQPEKFPAAMHIGIAVALTGEGKAWFDDLELIATKKKDGDSNLINNGDMEDIAADRPAGWSFYSTEGNDYQAKLDREEKKEGEQSLHLVGKAGGWVAGSTSRVALDRKRTYTLTGWARAKRGKAHVEINYFKGNMFLASEKAEAVTKDEWQERTIKANLDKHPEATHIAAAAQGQGDVEAWFDGFLMQVSGGEPETDEPKPPPKADK